jgi:hypothetical protein
MQVLLVVGRQVQQGVHDQLRAGRRAGGGEGGGRIVMRGGWTLRLAGG